MRGLAWVTITPAVALVCACVRPIVFACEHDEQCVGDDRAQGLCQPGGSCSYDDAQCPSRQRYGPHASPELAGYCVPGLPAASSDGTDGGGSTTEADAGPDPSTTTSATTGATAMVASTGEAPCEPETFTLPAEVASCRSNAGHDPDECAAAAGPSLMLIDLASNQLGGAEIVSYLAFLPEAPLTDVESIELRLWTQEGTNGSDATGEVWQTESFDGESLYSASPGLLADAPLGDNQGPATPGTMIRWELDPTPLAGQSELYFAIVPTSEDGLRYVARDTPGRTPSLDVTICR